MRGYVDLSLAARRCATSAILKFRALELRVTVRRSKGGVVRWNGVVGPHERDTTGGEGHSFRESISSLDARRAAQSESALAIERVMRSVQRGSAVDSGIDPRIEMERGGHGRRDVLMDVGREVGREVDREVDREVRMEVGMKGGVENDQEVRMHRERVDRGAIDGVEERERAFAAAISSMKSRREAGIDALVAHARAEGAAMTDRLYWTVVYDLERAPTTTNRAQLRLLGVEVPTPDSVDDEVLPDLLLEIAAGLARWGVYLQCTDHLSDRELYERLATRVLDEQVAELPPDSGASEHIDFAVDASSEVLDWYATRERDAPRRAGLADRDRLLPTPRRHSLREESDM